MPLATQEAYDELKTKHDAVYTVLVEAVRLLTYARGRTMLEPPRMDGSDWGTQVDRILALAKHLEEDELSGGSRG